MLVSDLGLLAGETLPLTRTGPDPGIGPTFRKIDVAIAHLAFAGPETGGDGDIVVDDDFDVRDFVALPVSGLEVCKQLGLGGELSVGANGNEVVSQHRGNDVGLASGLSLGPAMFQLSDGGGDVGGGLSEGGSGDKQ